MCGIAGIIRWDGRPVLEHEVRDMCGAMVHRGPDDEGVFIGDGVGLGQRRLSIIDLESGHQPMANEDGTVWIVFNGEIYNYEELRRDLVKNGHTFRTHGDTETIIHLYEDLGPRCVERLRGMFAFCIWDTRRRQVLLARDRMGIKPLYYAERNGELLFSSELKPILALPQVERSLNWEAVGHLFATLATPGTTSIVQGVEKLEPAHVAVASEGHPLRATRYWDVQFNPNERATEAELVEQLREVLNEAVVLHQVSDVPVGAFLSGGLDSSAIVAMMATPTGLAAPKRDPREGGFKTFSIGFAESSFNELDHARLVAKQFGTDHHDLVLRPDVVSIVEDLTWYLDEPFGDTSAIPTYMVSKLAAEHVKVVLSGDGGDEIFAGYDKYIVEGQERQRDGLPRPLRKAVGAFGSMLPEGTPGRRFMRHLALDGPERYMDAQLLFHRDETQRLFKRDAFEKIAPHNPWAASLPLMQHGGSDWLAAAQYRDIHTYLPLDILTKVDRMTMAHSLEARPPLLDHKLVEFAATVPAKFRIHDGTTKYLFKQAMRGILPDQIIDRQKHGFAVPLAQWFRGDLSNFARDLLLSDTCRQRGIFNEGYVTRLFDLNARGRDLDLQLWTMMSFELWCRRFLDTKTLTAAAPARSRESRRQSRAIVAAEMAGAGTNG